jgi:hypothetical protein
MVAHEGKTEHEIVVDYFLPRNNSEFHECNEARGRSKKDLVSAFEAYGIPGIEEIADRSNNQKQLDRIDTE